MSELTTTYTTDNGEPVERASVRAWELAGDAASHAYERLDEFPLGLVPPEVRAEWDQALRAVAKVRSQVQGVTRAAQRFASVGREEPLNAALADERFAGRIK